MKALQIRRNVARMGMARIASALSPGLPPRALGHSSIAILTHPKSLDPAGIASPPG
jgi:hypothetical protein